jgi:hypothetical protein
MDRSEVRTVVEREIGPLMDRLGINFWDIKVESLLDILEMLCDWKAAALRHNDGDIRRSIEINQERFGYSDDLKQILLNTLPVLEP